MNKKISIYALATLALMACSSSDGDEQSGAPQTKRPLTVVVNETPFVDENGNALAPLRQGTRGGTVITTETLGIFYMNYNGNKYTVEKGNDGWAVKPFDWPSVDDNEKISFYAYNAGTFYQDQDDNYITYEVSENASSQTDLLVAKHENISWNDAGGQVSLTFDHACAAVDFNVLITNKLSTELGTYLTVNEIKLTHVVKKGEYHYSTNSWNFGNTLEDYTDYTLTNGDISVSTTLQSLSCGTLFLLPQTLGEGAAFSIEYTINGTKKTATISMDDETWEAGKQYTINISLGTKTIQ